MKSLIKKAVPHGSALLVVLWALMVLSAAVFAWARYIQAGMQTHGYASQTMDARAMAHSGVAVALNPKITKRSPQLEATFEGELGYRVRLISEGGKLNLNWLVQEGTQGQTKLIMLKQWLERRGLSYRERERFVDCLIDYTDANTLHELNGAEDEGDYHPPNRPLISLDELMAVKGSEPLVKVPDWREDLTVQSSGGLDVMAASPELLRLIPGFSEARIQMLMQMRLGKDKIEGTQDDWEPKSSKEVFQRLGLSDKDPIINLISIKDPFTRILSEGRAGNVVRQVEVLATLQTVTPQILSWKE